MSSDGHAANMKVMSAVYYDKNQEALQRASSHGGGGAGGSQKSARPTQKSDALKTPSVGSGVRSAGTSSGRYFESTHK